MCHSHKSHIKLLFNVNYIVKVNTQVKSQLLIQLWKSVLHYLSLVITFKSTLMQLFLVLLFVPIGVFFCLLLPPPRHIFLFYPSPSFFVSVNFCSEKNYINKVCLLALYSHRKSRNQRTSQRKLCNMCSFKLALV